MMHGMPMSSVAPLGISLLSLDDAAPTERWMVSDDDFRFSEPLTVDALLVEIMLACFSCEIAE